jgi:hypothetical protein
MPPSPANSRYSGIVVQRLFHRDIAQAKPLLQEVDAQHCFNRKWPATRRFGRRVRFNQRHEFVPWHHVLHLIQERALARAPVRQVTVQVGLLHVLIMPGNLRPEHARSAEF